MVDWISRLYQKGDEGAIQELYENVFNVPMSLELWRWRYLDNPTRQTAILLAVSGKAGALAGQYALCPVRMKVDNQEIVGALSLDTMVHPDFRGQNMFTKMADDLYQRIAATGMSLIYGFPNSQSHRGFTKYLGWKDLVTTLPVYVRPLMFPILLKKVLRSNVLSNLAGFLTGVGYKLMMSLRSARYRCYTVKIQTRFDERFNKLWEQACGIASILVRRDCNFLNWRYSEKPQSNYTILVIENGDTLLGYCILRVQELAGLQVGFIADLLVHPEEKYGADALLEAAVKQAELQGCVMVNCMMLKHIPYLVALKRRGFILAPDFVLPQEIHLGVRNNGSNHPDSYLQNSTNWYITWGDHDRV
jgi:hypothetical protein